MKTTVKTLAPGMWRIRMAAGQEVVRVAIKGMRARPWPLVKTAKAEFHSRLMKRPNGEVAEAAVLRGMPVYYLQDGPYLMLWPSPAHSWQLEIDTVERVQA